MSGVFFPMGAGNIIFLYVLTSTCVYLLSHPLDTGTLFRGNVKGLVGVKLPFTSLHCRGSECMELHLHSQIPIHVVALNKTRTSLYNVFEKVQQMHLAS